MDATKQRRVALYARVSTEEQALQGYSIDAQKECIYAECKLHNKVVVDISIRVLVTAGLT